MMHIEKFNELYEQVRLDIIKKVQKIGKTSIVGFKTIKIKDSDSQFCISGSGYIVEVGEDYLFNKYGQSFNFSCLDFEDLCNLVDYLNTLKK